MVLLLFTILSVLITGLTITAFGITSPALACMIALAIGLICGVGAILVNERV